MTEYVPCVPQNTHGTYSKALSEAYLKNYYHLDHFEQNYVCVHIPKKQTKYVCKRVPKNTLGNILTE